MSVRPVVVSVVLLRKVRLSTQVVVVPRLLP
jgi:hypothetical protein